jgi:hypothetical protein
MDTFFLFLSLGYISLHQNAPRPAIFLKIRGCRQRETEIQRDSSKNMLLFGKNMGIFDSRSAPKRHPAMALLTK